ncbi:MAG: type II 3-dehydroquinate dehydratase [Gemmatimonadota bacterium]
MRIGVVNGPNLNVLGAREPQHYGPATLADIEKLLRDRAVQLGAELAFFQSNHEGELVDWIQREGDAVDGWLVNAGALTHGSIALRDVLIACGRPFVEVHLSNIYAREPFRRESMLADRAVAVVAGFRERSYTLGLEGLVAHLTAPP